MDLDGIEFDLGEDEEVLQKLYAKIDEVVAYVKDGTEALGIALPTTLETGQNRLKDLFFTTVTDNRESSECDIEAIQLFLTIFVGGLAVQNPATAMLIEEISHLVRLSVDLGRTIGREEMKNESK